MFTDKRTSPRLACHLPSTLKDRQPADTWSSYFVSIQDISRGGLRLRTFKPIPERSRILITFCLPYPHNKKNFEAEIEPVWSRGIPEEDCYEHGARFVRIGSDADNAIREVCRDALAQQP